MERFVRKGSEAPMARFWNRVVVVFAVCLSLGLVACGGKNKKDNNKNKNKGDAMTSPDTDAGMEDDTAESDTEEDGTSSPDCVNDMDCDSGEECKMGQCVAKSCTKDDDCGTDKYCGSNGSCVDCLENSHCSDGEVCNTESNTCEASQCQRAGDSCDKSKDAGNGYECVDAGNGAKCMEACDANAENPCSTGQVCLPTDTSMDPATACFLSQCNGPADTMGCKDIENHDLFPMTSDFKCVSLVNDATMCMPAGSKKTGESCTATSPVRGLFCGENEPCEACQSGNVCIRNTCKSVCQADGDCSASNDTCVGKNAADIVDGTAGFCGEKCDAYSRGQCSDSGEGCTALNNDIGYCTGIGSKGFMEDCQPPDAMNPQRNECAEGMQCIAFQQEDQQAGRKGIYKCLPICNPPSAMDNNTDDNDATCGGTMYGRFVYLGQNPGNIDVYIDGNKKVEDLATGGVSDADGNTMGTQFYSFRPAELNIEVTDGSASNAMNPIATGKPFAKSGQARTWALTPGASGGLSFEAVDVPRNVSAPASGKAKIRAVHLVPDFMSGGSSTAVDVVAVKQSGSLGNGTELAAGANMGDSGDFKEVDADTYDVYIFPKGATRSSGNELNKLTGITVSADSTSSLYLKGTAATGDNEDLAAVAVPYTSAAKAPNYTCWTNSPQNPAPASGICFQGCTVDDYGQNSCYQSSNACSPLGGDHFCLPHGKNKVGDSCDPGSFRDCEEGARCQEFGDGSGKCWSYCVGGSSSNQTLTCQGSRTCTADMGSFGTCQKSCMPGNNFKDTNCPSNLQTCFPESADTMGNPKSAYCSASADKKEGDMCGGSSSRQLALQNCKPGMYCAYDSGTVDAAFGGVFTMRENESPTCKKACNIFEKNTGCPQGTACGVDLVFGASNEAGVCLEKAKGVSSGATGTRCSKKNIGKMCGPNSHCIDNAGTFLCIQFCDWETEEGCTGNAKCEPSNVTGQPIGGVGICQPQMGN